MNKCVVAKGPEESSGDHDGSSCLPGLLSVPSNLAFFFSFSPAFRGFFLRPSRLFSLPLCLSLFPLCLSLDAGIFDIPPSSPLPGLDLEGESALSSSSSPPVFPSSSLSSSSPARGGVPDGYEPVRHSPHAYGRMPRVSREREGLDAEGFVELDEEGTRVAERTSPSHPREVGSVSGSEGVERFTQHSLQELAASPSHGDSLRREEADEEEGLRGMRRPEDDATQPSYHSARVGKQKEEEKKRRSADWLRRNLEMDGGFDLMGILYSYLVHSQGCATVDPAKLRKPPYGRVNTAAARVGSLCCTLPPCLDIASTYYRFVSLSLSLRQLRCADVYKHVYASELYLRICISVPFG